MEQLALFDVLRRHAAMIVFLCVVAAVAGYAFSFLLPSQYEASALLLLRPQSPLKIDTSKADKEFLDFPIGTAASVETPAKTYIEIIRSPDLVGKVVRKLGLDQKLRGDGKAGSNPIADLIGTVVYGKPVQDDPFSITVRQVQKGLAMKTRDETYLFDINYTANDPQLAADVASTTANTFIDFMEEIRKSENQYTRDQLQVQLEQSRLRLENAQQALDAYQKSHSVFRYQAEYDSKLKVASELQVELVKADEAIGGSQSSPTTVALAAKRARLARSLTELESELHRAPDIQHELSQLEGDVKIASSAYEIVDKEARQAQMRESYATPEVRLVSLPTPPHLPSGPVRIKIAGIALIGALAAGIGIAFLLEYLNRRVRGVSDIEEYVGVKVLATIPRIARGQWRHAGLL